VAGGFDAVMGVKMTVSDETKNFVVTTYTEELTKLVRNATASKVAMELRSKVVYLAEGRFVPLGYIDDIIEKAAKGEYE